MPIDPSIPMQVGQGVAPPANMLDTFGKYQGIANAMSTNAAIQAHTAQTRQQTAQSSNDYASKQIGAWLALPDNLRTQATARQLIDHLAQSGAMQPANINVWHDIINKTTSQPELDAIGGHALVTTMSGPEAASRIFGQNTMPSTGGELVPGTMSDPMQRAMKPGTPGFAPSGGTLTNTLGPEAATEMVPHTVADEKQATMFGKPVGSQIQIMRSVRSALGGGGVATGPTTRGVPGKAAPIPAGAGGYPAPQSNAAPAVPSLAAPPTTNPTDIETYAKDQAAIPDKQRAVQTLDKALHASTLAAAGKGAANLNAMRQFLATMTPEWANALGFKPFEAANMNYDLAHKYMTDYARGVSVGGTDQARAMTEASNASTSISPQAARDVLKTNIGRERQDIAKVLTSPSQSLYYGRHAAKFAGDTDPRAFQIDHMTPEEIAALPKSGTPEGDKFDQSLIYAKKHGLIAPASGGP